MWGGGEERPSSMETERPALGGLFGLNWEVKGQSHTLQNLFGFWTSQEKPLDEFEESICQGFKDLQT